MNTIRPLKALVVLALAAALLLPELGCRKSSLEPGSKAPRSIKEAAAQLEAAFAGADAETKAQAGEAAAALRQSQYEKAVMSLQLVRARQNGTLEQGLAVQNTLVTLQAELAEAIEAGNADAKRAFQLLKDTSGGR